MIIMDCKHNFEHDFEREILVNYNVLQAIVRYYNMIIL
jgi:hypothetical protein